MTSNSQSPPSFFAYFKDSRVIGLTALFFLVTLGCGSSTEEPEPAEAPEPVAEAPPPAPVEKVEEPPPEPEPAPEPTREPAPSEAGTVDYSATVWAGGKEGELMRGLDGGLYEPYLPSVIEDVQRDLRANGLYEGPISGVLDEATMQALGEFQKQNDLKVSGVPTPRTRERLFEDPEETST